MSINSSSDSINAEKLAYWFFRLNGFLTIENFVVHPDVGREQRTDVDILGVRFPFRSEIQANPMIDFHEFTKIRNRPYIILVEVKEKTCNLNGPWTRKDDRNINRVLAAVGALEGCQIEKAAEELYCKGYFENNNVYISLACVGASINQELKNNFPCLLQITWKQVLTFIYERFSLYYEQKFNHPQWDETGSLLWNSFRNHRHSLNEFLEHMHSNAAFIRP